MTAPTVQAQPASAVSALIAEHDKVALALEAAAVVAAAGALHAEVQKVTKWVHGEWIRLFALPAAMQSGVVLRSFLDDLSGRLGGISVETGPVLLDYAQRARDLGVRQGFREADTPAVELSARVGLDTHTTVARAVRKARDKLAVTPRMVSTIQRGSLATVSRHLTTAVQARNIVDTATRTVVNAELNRGIEQVADHVGAGRLWVAERTACAACLALSGHVVDDGHEFPRDATFGAKPISWRPISAGGLTGPPAHPRCRCRSSPWLGHAGPPGSVDMPTALRREAERSILTGQRVPSESEPVRVQAADRLLRRIGDTTSPAGWRVPKSVKARARRAVSEGKFNN
jgi:hypothetical protein